ncbi:sensor histidine kinase [Paenibacillus bouchesdurhonensis]|uniref:sensor histidine kinase n=1 Tax=Paenibacillus bouchesdurhonensis TaxID=1870990 RepID=UPI000DA5F2DE|nr:sensor histidine kinase [Paenibacillus bouchesdurhonensis]
MRLLSKLGLDKTRGQIFVGFIVMMIIVLSLTVSSLYYLLSKVQKENAALYIDEIAEQVGGRLESLLSEINVLTLQLTMDERIQEQLADELQGQATTYDEKMQLRKILIDKTAYSETIREIELFSEENSLYPIVDQTITGRVGERYIQEANDVNQVGSMIWIGLDPQNAGDLLAIRRIKLEKLDYRNGGYLVIRIKPSLIEFISKDVAKAKGSIMRLLDADGNEISLTRTGSTLALPLPPDGDGINKEDYVTVQRKIKATDWQLEIMILKEALTEDIHFLQDVLIWASTLSIIVFALLSYYLSLLITSPIKRLTRVMQKGKSGTPRENPDQYFNREVNLLNVKYNHMVREINHLIKSVYEKELIKSKSEIKALHSQIHPHFLFNTLDSLYWAHIRKGEDELAQMVIRLADLFRYSIQSKGEDGFVTVAEELEQVKRYVYIMKMRWHERLQVKIRDNPAVHELRIPKLTIQPLIENAIVHGIEPLESGGMIELIIREQDGVVSFIVADNGVGMTADKLDEIRSRLQNEMNVEFMSSGKGIGMFNVSKLIQFHYGADYGIQIYSRPHEGTVVEVRIPAAREEVEPDEHTGDISR